MFNQKVWRGVGLADNRLVRQEFAISHNILRHYEQKQETHSRHMLGVLQIAESWQKVLQSEVPPPCKSAYCCR